MAVVAIYSIKGGVGKTTLAANLAYYSAMISCRRTLLWDLDAAGGAGFCWGSMPNRAGKLPASGRNTIFSREQDPAKLIRKTAYANLDLLPADESIRALDSQFASIGKTQAAGQARPGTCRRITSGSFSTVRRC